MRLNDQLALMEEFERSAAYRREKAMWAFVATQHQLEDDRRHAVEREKEDRRRVEEMILASSEEVAQLEERLDRYDAGVVDALMDNRHALDRAEDALTDIRRRAFVLPDGRLAYKSDDGQSVFDDAGNSVGRNVIDPAAIPVGKPTWEQQRGRRGSGSSIDRRAEWPA